MAAAAAQEMISSEQEVLPKQDLPLMVTDHDFKTTSSGTVIVYWIAVSDLQTLSSFGFRGEALSSLCALADVSVTTRTKEEAVGARLTYDHLGNLISHDSVARAVGTMVAVSKMFLPLPIRYKEFNRNIRREYRCLLSILLVYLQACLSHFPL